MRNYYLSFVEHTLGKTPTCSKDSKALYLERKRLLSIPVTVTERTELEILSLSHNGIKRLSTSTGNLSNLTTLNLNNNKLTQFPEVVVTLINLTHLFLSGNELSRLSSNMKNLEKLEELELRNNNIERISEGIVDLYLLKRLFVKGNPLTYEEIGNLRRLMDLKPQRLSIDITG